MRRENRICRSLFITAYIILITTMLLLLGVVFRYPRNHLIWWQMILGVVAGVAALLIAGAVWTKIYSLIGKKTWMYLLALSVFGVLLYVLALNRQGNENTLADYTYVYNDAMNLALGKEMENTNYFITYANNLKPMLLLSVLFRIAIQIGISPFHFVLCRNVILVLLVVWGCGYLAEKEDTRWRFPILISFCLLLPLWDMVSAFYTDSMSFGMGILTLAFLKKAQKSVIKWQSALWTLLAAYTVVLASIWKITAVIPVIACVLIFLGRKVSVSRRVILQFGIFAAIFAVGLHAWANTYEITKRASTISNPIISWVALGIKEDGSWTNNRELVNRMYEFSTKKEKQEYCVEYIRENVKNFWNPEHLIRKAAYNFADGNIGASAFLDIEQNDGTLIWEMFSPWGKYYWRTSQYCFCYLVTMYVLLLMGMILALYHSIRNQEPPLMLMICQLSFWGIAIFLMFWEASSRQLYNQMPEILLGSILSIDYFWKNISIKMSRTRIL